MIETTTFFVKLLAELSLIYLAVTFLVEVIRQKLPPQRMRALLQTDRPVRGMLVAAGLGAVTPFCSCSTVPLVAAMLRTGVAYPVVATFLVISPLANPAAFALLATLVGPLYAVLYLAATFVLALTVGALAFFLKAPATHATPADDAAFEAVAPWPALLRRAARDAGAGYAKLAPVFAVAAAVGALLYNNPAATEWVRGTLSGTGWWMVPVAAVIGVPVYASTAFLLPLGTALYANGVNLGVVTAFLMGATGFSVPEGILLHKLLGARALATLAGAFTVGVVAIGYLFQALAGLL